MVVVVVVDGAHPAGRVMPLTHLPLLVGLAVMQLRLMVELLLGGLLALLEFGEQYHEKCNIN